MAIRQPLKVSRLLAELSETHRVVLIGGLAVIAHGLSRSTKDAAAWLDPLRTPEEWSAVVSALLEKHPQLTLQQIGTWSPFPSTDLATRIADDRVIRIVGADRPLDLFREPHMIPIEDFDEVWDHATEIKDGIRLPSDIHLLLTKEDTGRPHDLLDIDFLQRKAEDRLITQVQTSSSEALQSIFDQFLTLRIAEAALENPHPDCQALGIKHLKELAQAGDPFAQQTLDSQ